MTSPASHDLAIIGAGIVGATIASLARRRRPDARILIADCHGPATGATALSAGLVSPFRGRGTRGRRSSAAYLHYTALLGETDSVATNGFVFLADDLAGVTALRDDVARLMQDAPWPLDLEQGEQAWSGADAFVVDGPRLVHHYLDDCRTGPTEILAARLDDACWTGAQWQLALGASSAQARHLVLATGAWPSRHLADGASLRTKKIVAFHLTDCPPPLAGTPILYFTQDQSFLLPRPTHANWLLSITSTEWDLPAGEGCTATDAEHALARRILTNYVPSLAGAVLQPAVAVDSYTDAFEPQIVPCAASAQGCAVLGSSGSGVRWAPALAEEALDAVGF